MSTAAAGVLIRPLEARELDEAARIIRLAFGTFLGLPDPASLWPDRDYAATRYRTAPENALAAELDGALAGTNFLVRWGSFAFFGPLTVRPELWERGIAKKLLAPTIERFDSWGIKHSGLFTFPHSPKHVALYQKFGFWPRFLTAVMAKPAADRSAAFTTFSSLDRNGGDAALAVCREIAGAILDGLDLSVEIAAVRAQSLGDTVLLDGDGFAVCHCGAGTEAGGGSCYVKFAAVRPGAKAEKNFERLLAACETFAARRGMQRVDAGVNLARHQAYRAMLRAGYRTAFQGVAMQRPDGAGYNRPEVFAIDDWR